jgi:sugar/nucleoside kinase (ribokinase family)
VDTPLLESQIFHLQVTPEQLEEQLPQLSSLRRENGILEAPVIVWEPLSSSCTPQNLPAFLKAARLVEVFSPNHIDLIRMCESKVPEGFSRRQVEDCVQLFLKAGVGYSGNGYVVIRAGAHGSLLAYGSDEMSEMRWFPAYYNSQRSKVEGPDWLAKVKNPSGAGGAFIGAFCVGLVETGIPAEAMKYGTVGASFAVEQNGLPRRTSMHNIIEEWNYEGVRGRLEKYRMRSSLPELK